MSAEAEVDLEAGDDPAILPVMAGMPASHPAARHDTTGVRSAVEVDDPGEVVIVPAIAGMAAEIESGPAR